MCAGSSETWVVAPDRNRGVGDRTFTLRRCAACGLGFVADPPGDLGPYYAGDYHLELTDAAAIEPLMEAQRFRIELLTRFKRGGRLLEVGPSVGVFARLAQRAGFEVRTIEYDAGCVRFLNDVLGIETVQSADPAAVIAEEARRYDAICLWHSIEHLPQPWRVIEAAAAHLAPSGVLLVSAPNPRCWQARLMGGHWPHFDLPRHLFQIDPDWLAALGRRLGLTLEFLTTRDAGSLYNNRFSWGMLLQNAAGRLGRSPALRPWLWRAGMAIGWTLQPFEGREGNGAAYTAILRARG
jgi:SAM-dependent methyltransferase